MLRTAYELRISDWSSDVGSSDLPIHDRLGRVLQRLAGRPACRIEFLAGVSLDEPNPDACAEIGRFLARFHEAVADFPLDRQNGLSLAAWRKLAAQCGDGLAQIAPDLPALEIGRGLGRERVCKYV